MLKAALVACLAVCDRAGRLDSSIERRASAESLAYAVTALFNAGISSLANSSMLRTQAALSSQS